LLNRLINHHKLSFQYLGYDNIVDEIFEDDPNKKKEAIVMLHYIER
jgi:hypothetical protein